VNVAIVLAATGASPPLILPWIRACAGSGVAFAAGDEVQVRRPR
jgi:hypothetical protein